MFSIFVGSFLPDPDLDLESGYGSTDLIESRSNPDQKHWLYQINIFFRQSDELCNEPDEAPLEEKYSRYPN